MLKTLDTIVGRKTLDYFFCKRYHIHCAENAA